MSALANELAHALDHVSEVGITADLDAVMTDLEEPEADLYGHADDVRDLATQVGEMADSLAGWAGDILNLADGIENEHDRRVDAEAETD